MKPSFYNSHPSPKLLLGKDQVPAPTAGRHATQCAWRPSQPLVEAPRGCVSESFLMRVEDDPYQQVTTV